MEIQSLYKKDFSFDLENIKNESQTQSNSNSSQEE